MLGLAMCLAPDAASAQAARPPYITLLPAQPVAGELVVLRHDVAACIDQQVFVEPTGARSVRVVISTSDTCSSSRPARVALHDLGRFPAGPVEIEYVECSGLPPPPLPLCTVRGRELLVIGGGPPRAIPVGGPTGVFVLAALLLSAGLRLPRRAGA